MYSRLKQNYKIILVSFLLVIIALVHSALLLRTFHIDKENNIRAAYDAYGDMPLHMTQVSKFAFQPLTDVTDPIYYGHRLQYPFIINFISGILMRFTGMLEFSVLAPVILLAWLNIFLLFYIYRKMIGTTTLACLGIILFYLGSGFSAFAESDLWRKVASGEFISINVNNMIGYPAQSIDFTTPLINFFLFQRSFLLGFFFFLLFIATLLLLKERQSTRYAVLSGILLGLMPMMHMHTFIASVLVMGVFLLFQHKVLCKKIIIAGVVAFLIALPQVLYLVNFGNVGSGFVHFRLGWMTEPSVRSIAFGTEGNQHFIMPFIHFFLLNFGLLVPVFLAIIIICLIFFIRRRNSDFTQRFAANFPFLFSAACALLLFLIVQTFRFQPWDFDDNKILVYFQFFEVIVLLYFYNISRNKKPFLISSVFIIFLAVSLFSGVLDVISHLQVQRDELPVIYTKEAQELAYYLKDTTKNTELVITGTEHNNPVNGLLGRPAYLGYTGWLWTRGLPYSEKEQELLNFYSNPSPQNDIFKHFPAYYVLIDKNNKQFYPTNPTLFQSGFDNLFENNQYVLFKIKEQ